MTEDKKGAYRVGSAVFPLLKRCLDLNHEFNKHVAGIVGYCQFLLDDRERLQPDQRLSIEEIRDCAIKIQATLDELSAEKATLAKEMDLRTLDEKTTGSAGPKATD